MRKAAITLSGFGLGLTLIGIALVIAAFFLPWFDVYKLNDPSYPFPQRGYGPWTILRRGLFDSLGILAGFYTLLILALLLSGLALALARTAQRQSQARASALIWALLSLTMLIVVVPEVPASLSFSWPYLSSDIAYGVYLTATGLLGALVGLILIARLAMKTAPRP